MSPPRVVLDTNVLLLALLFPSGALVRLRHVWQADEIRPLMSHDTALELVRVLAYPKFALTAEDREDLLADILPWCDTVAVPPDLTLPACRDPAERPFLALALAAPADALVSRDKDLLAVRQSFAVAILSPAEFSGTFISQHLESS